jgi:5'-nucleotidase
MRVLVDMDGVLADFEAGFLREWRLRHPEALYVPLEERTTFYIRDQYPAEYSSQIWDVLLMPGFFRNLPVIGGGYQALTDMRAAGIEVFICTGPFIEYENCVLEKYQWVDEHLGREWIKRMVLTMDKTIVDADYLIDDMPKITGVNKPRWQHVLYDLPKNRMETGKKRLTWANWREVMLMPTSRTP